jgi:hypothetical protein
MRSARDVERALLVWDQALLALLTPLIVLMGFLSSEVEGRRDARSCGADRGLSILQSARHRTVSALYRPWYEWSSEPTNSR